MLTGWPGLIIAVFFEVAATTALRLANGIDKPLWLVMACIGYFICFTIISFVFKTLPMGIVYAVWAGGGLAIMTIISQWVFKETLDIRQIACILLILVGVIGLNLLSPA
ncbi:MAG: multidrug efflux SMR transporter [Zymomonas mobilis subsp. pomaceae]|uniref:Small multidrug resistance protein n=1 Tax=Zymomonas mobilis subsp. pomaceae (strain ATCC 29192 / DSM 22645 / JCM 10191 / CCUG 17912 / NBRC 13757 / NCIMB 11200 / NRRL B-4491 / Barker I) TaxID=579138 RepID=F8ETI9_ZYMMT|nr:multidrug efflux SMR transporter [Zymomonas mobilis]AEI38014.1 small multidrug resistance protein [Zymomonas mobilis subsp. pomaceae ATCC 29192]MDX5949382.1 multidrug efflux SMR transporter [Zymomonas mobilis subsp. pomaceae]GEB89124.1 multidrug SMR transporter [Zymomonas mobilis subsp. pomaceae]